MYDLYAMPVRSFMSLDTQTLVVTHSLPSLDAGFRHPCRNDASLRLVYNDERGAWERSKLAPLKLAPLKLAPLKLAPLKLAPLKLASLKLAPLKLAPLKLASLKLAPLKLAPLKLAPLKLASLKLASLKFSPVGKDNSEKMPRIIFNNFVASKLVFL